MFEIFVECWCCVNNTNVLSLCVVLCLAHCIIVAMSMVGSQASEESKQSELQCMAYVFLSVYNVTQLYQKYQTV